MTERILNRPKFFNAGLLAMLAVFSMVIATIDAGAQSSGAAQTLYWCKHDNGAEYGQTEPCQPGMEVRSSPIIPGTNGLTNGQPVQGPVSTNTTPPTQTRVPSAPIAPAPRAVTDTARKGNEAVLKEGQYALLKLVLFGVIFGGIAKLLGRSFWSWFVLGIIARIVLVSLDLMKF